MSAGTALAWTAPVLPQLSEASNSTDQRFTVTKSEGKSINLLYDNTRSKCYVIKKLKLIKM